MAGLVGVGLSKMWAASGIEDPSFEHQEDLSVEMGLFLQKVNIIRDYLEDIVEDRVFWPAEVWSKHARSLEDFKEPENIEGAVHCLNELVTDAMRHIPSCLDYMSRIKNLQIFKFCAIPQVMAIATLSEVYNNKKVFSGVVKIRKGVACKMILQSDNMGSLKRFFSEFTRSIRKRIPEDDPSATQTLAMCNDALKLIGTVPSEGLSGASIGLIVILAAISGYVVYRNRQRLFGRFLGGRTVGAGPRALPAARAAMSHPLSSVQAGSSSLSM